MLTYHLADEGTDAELLMYSQNGIHSDKRKATSLTRQYSIMECATEEENNYVPIFSEM